MTESKRETWIDFAKGIAILGVLIDHSENILYFNSNIKWLSFYSVSLFIICLGVTSIWGWMKRKTNGLKFVKKRILAIFFPYMVATFVYELFEMHFWGFNTYLDYLVHFSASSPFYYVSLAIQLLCLIPLLAVCTEMREKNIFYSVCVIVVLFVTAWFSINHSNILDIYGGGGVLCGGTYILLFYLGMVFGKKVANIEMDRSRLHVISFVSAILAVIIGRFIVWNKLNVDGFMPFGKGINPPSISLMTYAIVITVFCYGFGKIMDLSYNVLIKTSYSILAWVGRHTLFIFLYHRVFLDYIFPYLNRQLFDLYSYRIGRIFCFMFMILGPICFEFFYKKGSKTLKDVYLDYSVKYI